MSDVTFLLKGHAQNLIQIAKKIEAMLKKEDNRWKCIVCGEYRSRAKTHLNEHIETHIESLKYQCDHCEKVIKSTNALIESI